jgi:hypothetical protein
MQNVEGYAGSAGTEPHAWETGVMDTITYVGLGVHKASVSVALAESGRGGKVRQLSVFDNRPEVMAKLAARLSKGGRHLSFCYEAGPCGYGLHRFGHDCIVVAPSLIPAMAKAIVDRDWRRVAVMPSLTTRRQDGGQINPEPAMPDRSSALYLAVAVSRRGDLASSCEQSGAFSR